MEITISVSLSGCPCCSDGNVETIRCAAFVEKARQKYGVSAEIRVFPDISQEFRELKNSLPKGCKLKTSVVLIGGRIVSKGAYPPI